MRILLKKSTFLVASVLTFSLFFNSIVYACSKLAPMSMALQASSMNGMDGKNGGTVERGPCEQHKQDVCKSVRDRMLSVQPSVSKAVDAQPLAVPTLPLAFGAVEQTVLSPERFVLEISYHPVFKLSLPVSFLTLRI